MINKHKGTIISTLFPQISFGFCKQRPKTIAKRRKKTVKMLIVKYYDYLCPLGKKNINKSISLIIMRLEGRRESENVEDRRGMGTGTKIGLGGIGGLILAGLITLLMG